MFNIRSMGCIIFTTALFLTWTYPARAETDEEKLRLLETYAPRVWMNQNEEYFPSAVEWAFQHMVRFKGPDGRYWLRTKQQLSSPSNDSLPLFRGNLDSAPVYAFWVEKPTSELEKQLLARGQMTTPNIVDLVYFFYYPYNRGKEVANTIWGNHVSDWEHISVRLEAVKTDGVRSLQPTKVYIAAHNFGGDYPWGEIAKVVPNELQRQALRIEGTFHPVIYSAWGSHGSWKDPGAHVYDTAVGTDLTDHCNNGTAWDTWGNVVAFDYNSKKGLGSNRWPRWMGEDFEAAGEGPDQADPANGAIYRWGNPQDNGDAGIIAKIAGQNRLENGPTGPISKDTWGPNLR